MYSSNNLQISAYLSFPTISDILCWWWEVFMNKACLSIGEAEVVNTFQSTDFITKRLHVSNTSGVN